MRIDLYIASNRIIDLSSKDLKSAYSELLNTFGAALPTAPKRKKVLNEVRIFHSLKNRHILKFYNWYETRNHLWIIFEYCAGGDLFQLIE